MIDDKDMDQLKIAFANGAYDIANRMITRMIVEERGACANEAESIYRQRDPRQPQYARAWNEACHDIAGRIRERGTS